MPNSDLAIVVLAAGKGTRLKSALAKALHRAGGRTLVEHVVRACRALAAKKTCVVVGYQADDVASAVSTLDVETVLQDPQRGTGHAMLVARSEEHTSELQSLAYLVCRLLIGKK